MVFLGGFNQAAAQDFSSPEKSEERGGVFGNFPEPLLLRWIWSPKTPPLSSDLSGI